MELRHLRYFLAVADDGNFTRAAEKLGIGQPPLSQQIKSLETELGVKLFRRTAHGVLLTPAGFAFQAEAQRVLEGSRRAARAAQRAGRGETGALRVGFTGSAAFNPVVPTLIRMFREAYPDVELTLEEANTLDLLPRLTDDLLDLVFIRPGPVAPEGVRLHRFADEAMKIAVPAVHPLAGKRRAPVTALADEPFVLFPRAVGITLYEEVMRVCRDAGFEPRLGQPGPQIASVINLVAAGLGVSIVPASIAQVRVEGVRYLDVQGPQPKARLAIATRSTETLGVVENFVGLIPRLPG